MQPKFKESDKVVSSWSGKEYIIDYYVFDDGTNQWRYVCYEKYNNDKKSFQFLIENDIRLYREEIKLKPCPNCENKNIKMVDTDYNSDSTNQPKYYDELNDRCMTVCCSTNHGGCGMSMGFGVELETNIKNWNNLKRCL